MSTEEQRAGLHRRVLAVRPKNRKDAGKFANRINFYYSLMKQEKSDTEVKGFKDMIQMYLWRINNL